MSPLLPNPAVSRAGTDMAIIYSRHTGEPYEVSQELADCLLVGEWPKGEEHYSLDPPAHGAKG